MLGFLSGISSYKYHGTWWNIPATNFQPSGIILIFIKTSKNRRRGIICCVLKIRINESYFMIGVKVNMGAIKYRMKLFEVFRYREFLFIYWCVVDMGIMHLLWEISDWTPLLFDNNPHLVIISFNNIWFIWISIS